MLCADRRESSALGATALKSRISPLRCGSTGVRRRARSPLSRVCPLSPLETTQAHTGHREMCNLCRGPESGGWCADTTRPGTQREAPTHATQSQAEPAVPGDLSVRAYNAERRLPLLSRRDGDASIGGVGRRPLGRLLVERGGDERDGEASEPLL